MTSSSSAASRRSSPRCSSPASIPPPALIAALALFAAGFAFRPLGALIFGVVGDRLGRKGAFLITVSLMGAATFLIGFLPTYAQAGALGPALLILLRILQGIALGGEYGGAAIYVAEHAPNDKRGASTGLDPVVGFVRPARSLAGHPRHPHRDRRGCIRRLGLARAVPRFGRSCSQSRYGCAPSSPRARTSPSCARKAKSRTRRCAKRSAQWQQSKARADRLLRHHVRAGRGLVLHLLLHAGVPRKIARLAGQTKDLLLIVMTVVSAPLYVFFGWLSDRVGRKPVMLGGMLLALVLYFPGSHWIADAANPALVAAQKATPVVVETDPATCSVQFDPARHRQVHQRLRHRQERARDQGRLVHDAAFGRRSDAGGRRHRVCADSGRRSPAERRTSRR